MKVVDGVAVTLDVVIGNRRFERTQFLVHREVLPDRLGRVEAIEGGHDHARFPFYAVRIAAARPSPSSAMAI